MKLQRIFLSGFLAVSCVFLSGYIEAAESHRPAVTKQKPVVEVTLRNNTKFVKTNLQKSAIIADNDSLAKQGGLQKPLDISIPHMDIEENGSVTGQNTGTQDQETNIFASENKNKTRSVQVDGRLLTSQDPEGEKLKSTEGAGIVINIKP